MPRQGNKGKYSSGSKSVKLGPGFPPQLLNRLLRSQRRCIPFRNTFPTMYNTSQCSRGIPNKSDSEQKYDNFYFSSPKAATDMGVTSSESHDLTAFYEMLSASFGVLSQNTGFYPSLDRIVETMLGPLNLGPGGRSYNEPISHLQRFSSYRGNPGTSFTDLDPEGDLPLFPCLGLLAAQLAMYGYLRRFYGFSQKGDGLFHSRSLWKLQRKPGQFNALSGFSDIFPSTHRILDEFDTHGKPFTRKIQRRRFQEVWSRTR